MRLRHGVLRPVQAVQNQLPEEGISRNARGVQVLLAFPVHDEHVPAAVLVAGDVHVFPDLDESLRALDEHPPVAPGPQPVRRKPVHPEIVRRAVLPRQAAVAEVFQFRIFRVRKVPDPARGYRSVLFPGVEKVLFNLVAPDVAKDPAVFFPFKEPCRPSRRAQAVRPEPGDRNHLSDLPAVRNVSRQDRSFVVQPLRVVNHVFLSGPFHRFPGRRQLLQRRERRLVRKVVLPRFHRPQPKRAALARNRRPGNQLRLRVLKRFLLAVGRPGLGKSFQESRHLLLVRVVNIFQRAAGLRQPVAHPVNMSVIQPHGGKDEFPVLHHRRGFSFRCIVHSVGHVHFSFPPCLKSAPNVSSPVSSITEAVFS